MKTQKLVLPLTLDEAHALIKKQHQDLEQKELQLIQEAKRTAEYRLQAEQMEQRWRMANGISISLQKERATLVSQLK